MKDGLGLDLYWFFHEPPQLELLYGLAMAHWKQGFAAESARAMIAYGFEQLSFDRIVASTDAVNEQSVRVMQRLGMSFWKQELTNGLDTIYYSLAKENYDPDPQNR